MADQYSRMLADSDRIEQFDVAIRKEIQADDVVVDLGCGLGTFAMQAARAGARRVFGVEFDPIIELASQISEMNGTDVEFIAGDARDVQLPEKASVLIFEDYGTGLLDGIGAKLLEVARENWVTDQYRVLPQGASLQVAPICSESTHQDTFPLGTESQQVNGFDFAPLADLARNTVNQIRGARDMKVIAPPKEILTHNFMEPLPTSLSETVEFEIGQNTLFDGVCIWHDLHLNDDITYSNHPDNLALWGQYYFPTPTRWSLTEGDRVSFEVYFHDALEDGFWKWKFELRRSNGDLVEESSGNTFASTLVTGRRLQELDVAEDKDAEL